MLASPELGHSPWDAPASEAVREAEELSQPAELPDV